MNTNKELRNRVRLLTKDMFILERTIANKMRISKHHLNDIWDRIAKGHNFIIQTEDGILYSIPYLENILKEDRVGECKLNDIKLLIIEYQYVSLVTNDSINKTLQGITVTFDFKNVHNCKVEIETETELETCQIKSKIIEALGI